MFKDFKKYLTTTLKIYLFLLVIIFILKLVGLDYFGLDINNRLLITLSDKITKYNIQYLWYFISLYIYTYIMISLSINEYNNKIKIYSLVITTVNYINSITIKNNINNIAFSIMLDLSVMMLSVNVYNLFAKKLNLKSNLKMFLLSIVMIIYQAISSIARNQSIYIDYENFIINFLLNFDYIIMMIITYKLLKGGVNVCGVVEVYLSSLKKLNLKNLLTIRDRQVLSLLLIKRKE